MKAVNAARYNVDGDFAAYEMEELKKRLQEEIAALEYELRNELPKEILKARAHGDLVKTRNSMRQKSGKDSSMPGFRN